MANGIKRKLLRNEELEKQYEITMSSESIISKIGEELNRIQKTYKVDGFRVGKVPTEVIKKKEGSHIFFSIAERMTNDEVFKIVDEEKLNLSSRPKVEIKDFEENKDVVFTVIYNMLPNIPEVELKKIKIDSYKINVKEEEIEEKINKILSNFKEWHKVEKDAKIGDSVKINFDGKVNGESFSGGKAEDYQLELGSKSFIDGFEEQLVGKKAGDDVLVKVKFPENYHSSALAGKEAEFEVKILEVLEANASELSDEFLLKNFGIDSVEKFRNIIREDTQKTYDKLVKNKISSAVFDKLVSEFKFNLPQNIVKEQFDEMKNAKEKENLREKKEENIDENELKKQAEKAVKLGLILGHIGKEKKMSVSDNEIEVAIMENAMQMKGYEQMVMDFYKKNKEAVNSLRQELLENKILDYVIENITKNIREIDIEEFKKLK